VELALTGREYHVVDILAGGASEALDLARRSGGPVSMAQSLTALAGAIADREPRRARALLAESLELRATIESQRAYANTSAALIAARIADWPLVLKLGPDTIRGSTGPAIDLIYRGF
jgi:hypothetical protein